MKCTFFFGDVEAAAISITHRSMNNKTRVERSRPSQIMQSKKCCRAIEGTRTLQRRHRCIQSDNTVAACKNAETALFMGIRTRRFAFDSTNICYLRKGRTHEDVDFIFSFLLARVLRKIRVHTPLDLVQGIHAGMESLLLSTGYQCHVDHVSHARDFGHWVAPLGIKPYNCFQNRQKIETPHSFTWKLSRAELQALAAGGIMPAQFPSS